MARTILRSREDRLARTIPGSREGRLARVIPGSREGHLARPSELLYKMRRIVLLNGVNYFAE